MKKVMLAVMCAVMLFGTTISAFAEQGGERGEWRGGIRSRIHASEEKIERGTARGTLTRPEAHRLHEELNRILGKIDRMKDDGHLSQREREAISHDLDSLDRDITKEKRNDHSR